MHPRSVRASRRIGDCDVELDVYFILSLIYGLLKAEVFARSPVLPAVFDRHPLSHPHLRFSFLLVKTCRISSTDQFGFSDFVYGVS